MYNNIKEPCCSLEVIKLLKEKGFEINMSTAPKGYPTAWITDNQINHKKINYVTPNHRKK